MKTLKRFFFFAEWDKGVGPLHLANADNYP